MEKTCTLDIIICHQQSSGRFLRMVRPRGGYGESLQI